MEVIYALIILTVFFFSYMFYMQYKINNAWREYSRLKKIYENMNYDKDKDKDYETFAIRRQKAYNEAEAMGKHCHEITPLAYLFKYTDKYGW